MTTNSLRIPFCLVMILSHLAFGFQVYAAPSCVELLTGAKIENNKIIQSYVNNRRWPPLLQQQDSLIKNPSGACGAVCAINIVQLLHAKTKGEPLTNLAEILNYLHGSIPSTVKGLSTAELVAVLRYLVTIYLAHANVRVRAEGLAHSHVQSIPGFKRVRNLRLSALQTINNKLQIVGFNVINGKGLTVGTHFVLLAGKSNDSIEVYDPNDMLSAQRIRIREVQYHGHHGHTGKMIELIPQGDTYYQTYGLDARFFIQSIVSVDMPKDQ